MAYNKKYAELGESVIDYVNDREDKIEGAFGEVDKKIPSPINYGDWTSFAHRGDVNNANLIEFNGIYTVGENTSNVPYNYGLIVHFNRYHASSVNTVQLMFATSLDRFYYRRKDGSGYHDWVRVL